MVEVKRLDLFKLHDEKDLPKGFVVAKGKNFKEEIERMIHEIEKLGITKTRLVKHIMNKLGISIVTAERLIYSERKCEYIKREWFPIAFIEEITRLSGNDNYYKIQDKIEYIRIGNSASKPLKPAIYLTETLCKIAGAHAADGTLFSNKQHGILIRLCDQHESAVRAYSKWILDTFNLELRVYKSKFAKEMWEVAFSNKIIGRYLNKFFGFRYGCKTYDVKEPEIIKNTPLKCRKAFALGFLTFESGIGMKNQIELCIRSRQMRDDIFEILTKSSINVVKMEKQSYGMTWRLWSKKLSEDEAIEWLEFFEQGTEKWFKLYEYINGFQGKINNFEDATKIFSEIFPLQPASKTSILEVLSILKRKGITWRYDIENETKLKSKWAHSISHYISILKEANVISVKKERFGKKKSFGTIVRDVYTYNPNIQSWNVPYRSWLEREVRYCR